MKSVLLLQIFCCVIAISTQLEGASVTVDLPFGSIKGYSNGDSWQFYGIPFAAPPVGDLRWQPPTDFIPWTGSTLDANYPPPACIQNCQLGMPACAANMSEDCLYLNIFIPISWTPGSNMTYDVLLFIYGGSFIEGTSGCLLYDSKFFTKFTDTIIVTFNYRVGALGFLRNPAYNIDGNMGFIDQRVAMQWVNNYISYFGGNGKITLFGESAGAISVGAHLASPLSTGLFRNAIVESDPWTIPLRSTINADVLGEEFFLELDCITKRCIFDKTSEEILSAPIIDNINLLDQPLATLLEKAKTSAFLPVIIGTTTNEGLLFIERLNRISPVKGEALYNAMLLFVFPYHFESVVNTYNSLYGVPTNYVDRLSLIAGDYVFLCPTRKLLATISDGEQYAWGYLWNRGETYNASSTFCYNIPCHGSELPYVFGTPSLWDQQFTPNDLNLSRQIQTYWRNMAYSSDPNMGSGGTGVYPAWPRYETRTGVEMFFDEPIGRLSYNYSDRVCDFLDTIGYDRSDIFGNSSVIRSFLLMVVVAVVLIGLINSISSY
ncbi:acetylcholinesterase isoform E4-E6 precursor [Oopsacas minuta]|uniref:Acetylcholinesterase isoform E4-E6 n=1 Tax=Oopsacas minuta TaxID=111878 RepID=A0AAV7KLS8_9METZ|nr:acetylcholinesterase isoform E4-E6 precursor [Oopsacas minuta]